MHLEIKNLKPGLYYQVSWKQTDHTLISKRLQFISSEKMNFDEVRLEFWGADLHQFLINSYQIMSINGRRVYA